MIIVSFSDHRKGNILFPLLLPSESWWPESRRPQGG